MEKFYVVVRADLPAGAQATQAAHAAIAFCIAHRGYIPLANWHANSNNLVLLAVPDEAALDELHTAVAEHVPVEWFHEPDFGDSLTAIAFPGTAETIRLVSSLPLALRVPLAA